MIQVSSGITDSLKVKCDLGFKTYQIFSTDLFVLLIYKYISSLRHETGDNIKKQKR